MTLRRAWRPLHTAFAAFTVGLLVLRACGMTPTSESSIDARGYPTFRFLRTQLADIQRSRHAPGHPR